MPLYEYKCTKCGRVFESLIRNSKSKITCPNCKSSRVKKLFSSFGFKSSGGKVASSGSSTCGSCTASSCSTCKP